MMPDTKAQAKAMLRACHFLARGPAMVGGASAADKLLLDGGSSGTVSVARATLETLIARGLVAREGSEGRVDLTPEGRAYLARACAPVDPFQDQHRHLETVHFGVDGEADQAIVNIAESPLALLARRKGADGRAFLSAAECRAGERLRADYTRGLIMPRLGANWLAAVASGRRGDAGGAAELTEAALAARQRVNRAIESVGPELAGVLIDVCCFLKGLETVEAERRWPVRSAKVVLKTALGALVRHYEPTRERRGHVALHWGSEDYRPSIR